MFRVRAAGSLTPPGNTKAPQVRGWLGSLTAFVAVARARSASSCWRADVCSRLSPVSVFLIELMPVNAMCLPCVPTASRHPAQNVNRDGNYLKMVRVHAAPVEAQMIDGAIYWHGPSNNMEGEPVGKDIAHLMMGIDPVPAFIQPLHPLPAAIRGIEVR